MGAERGIPEARCQPGPDFILAQIISHRSHQLIENVSVNFVEWIVIQCGKIIAVRKFGRAFPVSPRTVEDFYDGPKGGGGRNRRDPYKWRRQPRGDGFAQGIHIPGDPFVSFVAVKPNSPTSAIPPARSQTRKTGSRVRQMV